MKNFAEIQVRATKLDDPSHKPTENDIQLTTLHGKLTEFIPRFGALTSNTLGFVLQLLSVGKVRMDFRDHHERLELLDKTELVSRGAALEALDEYLASIGRGEHTQGSIELTQKIIIQTRK